jgi:hypothetical protein
MKALLKVLLITIVFVSCSEDDELKETCVTNNPMEELVWLKQLKSAFEQSTSANVVEIYEYRYKQQRVFYVNDCVGCADGLTKVYSCTGNVMCEFGGVAGLNTCPDFTNEAADKKLLWTNNVSIAN